MHLDHILAHVEQLPYLAELLVRLLEVVSVLSDLLGELHNLQQVLLVHLNRGGNSRVEPTLFALAVPAVSCGFMLFHAVFQ